ncbi:unnamed protein product [Cladocopium goreaui]|uniref:Uncharacterized protein n=1 Tax=Cladocopium goreaui TaxID=2562237 RepID=A0A9P1BWL6_9DINO|nr:unnamed protein product [Cladocopium goreaui]|mmetsp:Transcript_63648/g.139517  ORF Transcript_63648/g.139517 Transcript_63648/m.139517 type:complete len:142 (-) Transcript_63648:284-709(-)
MAEGGRLCALVLACAAMSAMAFVGSAQGQGARRKVTLRAIFPWQQLPQDYVPPKRPYNPVYDSDVAKRVQEEWMRPKERPWEDYFNEWFIPVFLLIAFIWIFPLMSPGTWAKQNRRSNRAKARSAARNLMSRLKNFGKEAY